MKHIISTFVDDFQNCLALLNCANEIKLFEVSKELSKWSSKRLSNRPLESNDVNMSSYTDVVSGRVLCAKMSVTSPRCPPNLSNEELRGTKTSTLICNSYFNDGSRISQTERQPLNLSQKPIICEILHANEINWTESGTHVPGAPLPCLGSTNDYLPLDTTQGTNIYST